MHAACAAEASGERDAKRMQEGRLSQAGTPGPRIAVPFGPPHPCPHPRTPACLLAFHATRLLLASERPARPPHTPYLLLASQEPDRPATTTPSRVAAFSGAGCLEWRPAAALSGALFASSPEFTHLPAHPPCRIPSKMSPPGDCGGGRAGVHADMAGLASRECDAERMHGGRLSEAGTLGPPIAVPFGLTRPCPHPRAQAGLLAVHATRLLPASARPATHYSFPRGCLQWRRLP